MKRILGITTAALFGATMLATPVLAQSVTGDKTMEPSQTEDTLELDTGAEADVDVGTTAAIAPDFESAMGRIGVSGTADAIAAASEVGEVRIISMATLDNSDEARIDQAMGESEAEINALRAAVEGNEAISAELAANNVAAADVIAADMAADGSVIVYTR